MVAWRRAFVDALPDAARVHVKLDTGMGRLGTRDVEEALDVAREAQRRGLLVGAMTHFATATTTRPSRASSWRAFAPLRAPLGDGVLRTRPTRPPRWRSPSAGSTWSAAASPSTASTRSSATRPTTASTPR